MDPQDELTYEKTINAQALKQMGKAKALVDKALGLIQSGTGSSDLVECLKEASGLLFFRRHGVIEDGKMDEAIARAFAKAKETNEPCVLARAPGCPLVVIRRSLFEKEQPFGMGPEDVIFDTERGYLGTGWRSECADCGESTPIQDQAPHE